MRNVFNKLKLKNSVVLLIILIIICASTVIFLIMLNKNIDNSNNNVFIKPPQDAITSEELSLAGYRTFEMSNHYFFNNPLFYYTTAVFPEDAYVEYQITSSNKVLGDNVNKNHKIGENEGVDVKSDIAGIIIDIQQDKIVLQNLDCLYADIEVSFLNIDKYRIGEKAYVYYNSEYLTNATVEYIDYLSVQNNCLKVRLKIDNFPAVILTNTNITILFAEKDNNPSYTINSSFINREDAVYKCNQFFEFVIEEDNQLKYCLLKIGRVFYEYAEIEEIHIDGKRRIIDSGMVFYGKY